MANETVKYVTVRVVIEAHVEGLDGDRKVDEWEYFRRFGEGSGVQQVGYFVKDETRSLDTTSEDLQLDSLGSGSFTSASANNVKLLAFHNITSTGTTTLTLGGSAGGNEWDSGMLVAAGDKMKIGDDGLLLFVDPSGTYTITAADDLGVAASGTQTYSFRIAGDNA